ncbi:MAG TPA: cache domain-containing protein [Candidatus Babeliales bacterium]|nr:cache domain-containing protein [Candidatus Babeliales bacterium]
MKSRYISILFLLAVTFVPVGDVCARSVQKNMQESRHKKNRFSDHFVDSVATHLDFEGKVLETERRMKNAAVHEAQVQHAVLGGPEDVADTFTEQEETPAQMFDESSKQQAVVSLLKEGIAYLETHEPYDTFSKFTHDKQFIRGELYIFVFDSKGVCLAHGEQEELVWSDLYNLRGDFGTYFVRNILRKAQEGGGWVTYRWRNATKQSYVKEVRVGNKTYVLGVGYYPHSKADAVVSLVKGAVTLFNENVKADRSNEEALSALSYPMGRFVFGDLYLYAVDFDGVQVAHGFLPELIGSKDALQYQDSEGKFVNKEIIAKLKEAGHGGIWIEYRSRNALKKAYAEEVTDKRGKHYFIACGYYPEANRSQVEELVRRGYQYMKKNGRTEAVKEFSNRLNNEFRYGDISLFVYDLKGGVVAHGENQSYIGQNHYNQTDDSGFYYVRELIKKAESGGGFVDYKMKNSFRSTYVELVDLGIEKFVIGAGLYPISKEDTAQLLAKSGAGYLRTNVLDVAMREFVKKDGKFVRGDLVLFVFDGTGVCYAYGDEYDLIWRNLLHLKDDNGKSYVTMMINTAKSGAGRVAYTINGVQRNAYIEPVEKDGKLYIVGSAYYN